MDKKAAMSLRNCTRTFLYHCVTKQVEKFVFKSIWSECYSPTHAALCVNLAASIKGLSERHHTPFRKQCYSQ